MEFKLKKIIYFKDKLVIIKIKCIYYTPYINVDESILLTICSSSKVSGIS